MRSLLLAAVSLLCLTATLGCPPAPPKADAAPVAKTDGAAQSAETPPQPIRFDLAPAEGGSELLEAATHMQRYLTTETGFEFKVNVPTDYSALITAMQYDQTQFGALAPLQFVKAESDSGCRVLLKSVRKTGPYFYCAIFALKKNNYHSLDDLKGKKMAFGDPLSTSGTIFPKAGLIKAGMNPETYFSEARNVGNHEVVVNAVANGEYDAGATFCNTPEGEGSGWAQFLPERAEEFNIVWVSEKIPADTISVTDTFQDMYPQTTEKVKAALLKMNDTPEGLKLLHDLYRIEGLVEAQSSDYDIVREAARLVDFPIK